MEQFLEFKDLEIHMESHSEKKPEIKRERIKETPFTLEEKGRRTNEKKVEGGRRQKEKRRI